MHRSSQCKEQHLLVVSNILDNVHISRLYSNFNFKLEDALLHVEELYYASIKYSELLKTKHYHICHIIKTFDLNEMIIQTANQAFDKPIYKATYFKHNPK